MPLILAPLPLADREMARRDRKLLHELERACVLLRKARDLHEQCECIGSIDEVQYEAMRKLRAKGRSHAINAIEQDRKA
jgi:hypothetical protein